ncbi:MAG: S41 family peptidase [Gammaproteobacteria bacterium]|nr:S41 family peptidase [Gammaproteobacteria bacterium]MCY4219685.1 S41 family peptidase [Gammaproteobacteria bacterium]MCY4275739.1 S41 family peptidase [Gammaproteobacteria bacterium]
MKTLVKRSLWSFLWIAIVISPELKATEKDDDLPIEELQMFAEVFGKIKADYVEEIEDKDLLTHAINGMLAGLDEHSAFLEPAGYKQMQTDTDGQFGGLGIEVTKEDGLIKVVAPIDGTPADEAGLQSGDFIVEIDGDAVLDMPLSDALSKMRGEPGTPIELTIQREGVSELIQVDLIRSVIQIRSVRGELLEPGLGYLRLSSFQSGTAQHMRVQIKTLVDDNEGSLDGLVLDLRNNPGGILSSAVEISDMFLDGGDIVTIKGRIESSSKTYSAKPGDILEAKPMIILVNRGSASASEIVAGALQDHKRAVIVGTKTFGKGSVQSIIPINYGRALKLTTSLYLTPNDRVIQKKGISPDITAQLTGVGDYGLAEGQELAVDDSESEEGAGRSETTLAQRLRSDNQLLQAINLLKGMRIIGSEVESGQS